MLEIYPKLTPAFIKCPACGCQLSTPSGLQFFGQYLMADVLCSCCDVEYLHFYPAADKNDRSSFAFTKNGKVISYTSNPAKWKAFLLSRAFKNALETKVNIKIEKKITSCEVVLYNLLYDYESDVKTALVQLKGEMHGENIVVLILHKHRHLLKSDVSEVWTLEGNSAIKHAAVLNSFMHKELPRFEKVYLGQAGLEVANTIGWWKKLGLFLKL